MAKREPQAFLGEIALLYNCERTATVECGDKVRAHPLPSSNVTSSSRMIHSNTSR